MSEGEIRPGDLVQFDFWSKYLALSTYPDEAGVYTWHEICPGDYGLVVVVSSHVSASKTSDDTIVIMFSSINKLVSIHINQISRVRE